MFYICAAKQICEPVAARGHSTSVQYIHLAQKRIKLNEIKNNRICLTQIGIVLCNQACSVTLQL
jgi:hypothetical protein